VIQGANDPRVKQAESDQIVVALRDRNFPVEYLVAPDEGHGFAKPVNNMAAMAAAEKFLAKHIAGVRYQPDMTPEVAQRLATLTVDPKTVKLARKVDPSAISLVTPVRPLTPGKLNYHITMEMGGQRRELASSLEIARGAKSWTVTETMTAPQGTATDRAQLALDSLIVQQRSVAQGPVTIDYTVADGKAQGEMKVNGQARPVSLDLGGNLLAHGPGAVAVVGTFPLKEGYTTTLRSLNLQQQQVGTIEVVVAGVEKVTVPAGQFDSYKVELNGTDGTKVTAWIARDSFKPVRSVTVAPSMGGAQVTQELVN